MWYVPHTYGLSILWLNISAQPWNLPKHSPPCKHGISIMTIFIVITSENAPSKSCITSWSWSTPVYDVLCVYFISAKNHVIFQGSFSGSAYKHYKITIIKGKTGLKTCESKYWHFITYLMFQCNVIKGYALFN